MWPAFPSSEYYGLIRLPEVFGLPLFLLVRPTAMFGTFRVSQVPSTSFHTCHVFKPRQTLQNLTFRRFLCIDFRVAQHVVVCSLLVSELPLTGLKLCFRSYGPPYGLYGSLCTLHLAVTSFGATLDMGGWLDLSQQGLSPCQKY